MWTDGKCYKYELDQLENCKNKLKLNQTYVICDDEEKEVDDEFDDYALFTTFDNRHRQAGKPPPVRVDRQTICKVLQLQDACK